MADVSCAHRQGGAPTGIDANQHGLVRPLARAGIRRLHGMAVRRRSIQVRVTTANARCRAPGLQVQPLTALVEGCTSDDRQQEALQVCHSVVALGRVARGLEAGAGSCVQRVPDDTGRSAPTVDRQSAMRTSDDVCGLVPRHGGGCAPEHEEVPRSLSEHHQDPLQRRSRRGEPAGPLRLDGGRRTVLDRGAIRGRECPGQAHRCSWA